MHSSCQELQPFSWRRLATLAVTAQQATNLNSLVLKQLMVQTQLHIPSAELVTEEINNSDHRLKAASAHFEELESNQPARRLGDHDTCIHTVCANVDPVKSPMKQWPCLCFST
jgi:hypothetical protein